MKKVRLGQATVEYVLILFMVASVFLILLRTFKPVITRFQTGIENKIRNRFLDRESLHRFPLR